MQQLRRLSLLNMAFFILEQMESAQGKTLYDPNGFQELLQIMSKRAKFEAQVTEYSKIVQVECEAISLDASFVLTAM
jgi:hypothetical protein